MGRRSKHKTQNQKARKKYSYKLEVCKDFLSRTLKALIIKVNKII